MHDSKLSFCLSKNGLDYKTWILFPMLYSFLLLFYEGLNVTIVIRDRAFSFLLLG
jgi:hypothetical protein